MSHFKAFFYFKILGWRFFGLQVTLESDEDETDHGEKAKLVLIEGLVHGKWSRQS
jgi:hypothetical protein